jgi:hypothetical protein
MTEYKFGFDQSNRARRDGVAVTPSDSVDLPYTATGIWVGVTGNVALITPYGTTLTFVAVPAGTLLPVCASRVLSTGTTATSLVALY